MTIPRREVVHPEESGVYHCWSRCVRRAFLCGFDRLTGKNYDHRKEWTITRLIFLAQIFTIDVLAYAIMSTHQHLMLRTKPHEAKALSDKEVARRWLHLFHNQEQWDYSNNEPTEQAIQALMQDTERIAILRDRLCSVSWFNRCLKENIAVKANKEDEVTGHFWEKRFDCQRIEDPGALVTCMIYVDLNEIRAKVADRPEESEFTSAFLRIVARQASTKATQLQSKGEIIPEKLTKARESANWLMSFPSAEEVQQTESVLPLTLDEYLIILDETGKCHAEGKRGAISPELESILERLNIRPDNWLDSSSSLPSRFSQVIGGANSLKHAAKELGKAWLKGATAASLMFSC